MTNLVERLLDPAERDKMLDSLEAEMRSAPPLQITAGRPLAAQRQVFRVDAIRAIMVQAIRNHRPTEMAGPGDLTELADLVTERLLRLREDLARSLPNSVRAETDRQSARMVTLQSLTEYVRHLPTRTDMTVAQIDAEIEDVLAPAGFDWGDMQPLADMAQHQAAYELTKLRRKAVRREAMTIPDLERRMMSNHQAIFALGRLGLPEAACRDIVTAIRHEDIPHVAFVD